MNDSETKRTLSTDAATHHEFAPVPLRFEGGTYFDVFAQKNNKTLRQTLDHDRYRALKKFVLPKYEQCLEMPLGSFLSTLKQNEDNCYQKFLNKHGDLTYSIFTLADRKHLYAKGVYAYYSGSELRYIGRCLDSMKSRINSGYGKIHPKNCYIDGQATNCHLNALITQSRTRENISLWICEILADEDIKMTETLLIRWYKPPWNLQQP